MSRVAPGSEVLPCTPWKFSTALLSSKVIHSDTFHWQVLGRRRKEMLLEEYTGVPDAGDGGAPPQPKWAMQVPALPALRDMATAYCSTPGAQEQLPN